MGETVHIRALGASFSIQTDQNPDYVESLVDYVKEKIRIIESSAGSKESVKTAILVSLLLADELFQERSGSPDSRTAVADEEFASFTRELIERIDSVLDQGQNQSPD